MQQSPDSGALPPDIESLTTEDERWKRVNESFAAINLRLSSQDLQIEAVKTQTADTASTLNRIADDTKAIREAWNDGVATKKFFCRLAEGYKFIRKELFIPIILPMLGLYAIGYYTTHGHMPGWIEGLFKLVGL